MRRQCRAATEGAIIKTAVNREPEAPHDQHCHHRLRHVRPPLPSAAWRRKPRLPADFFTFSTRPDSGNTPTPDPITVDDFNFDGRPDIAVPRGQQGP